MALTIQPLTTQCQYYATASWSVNEPQGPNKTYTVQGCWLPVELDLFTVPLSKLLGKIYPVSGAALTGNRLALAQAIVLYKMTLQGGNEKLYVVTGGPFAGVHTIQVYPIQVSRTIVFDNLPVFFTEADFRLVSVVIPYVVSTFQPTLSPGEH